MRIDYEIKTLLHLAVYHDIDGNKRHDLADVGVKCIMADGKLDHACSRLSGGWPLAVTDPLGVTNYVTAPLWIIAEPAGTYIIEAMPMYGWNFLATQIDLADTETLVNPVRLPIQDDINHIVRFGVRMNPVSIHGHAYFDANKNGVRDKGEIPIAGMLICLITLNLQPVLYDASGLPLPVDHWGCQRSDAAGLVWWRNLTAGKYKIVQNMLQSSIKGMVPTGMTEPQ